MTKPSLTWEKTRAVSAGLTFLDDVHSTNTWLMQKETVTPTEIVITMNQTAGRGRWERQWINRAGEGLAVSFIVPQRSAPSFQSQVSTWIPLLIGVAVVKGVMSLGVREASLKWPNDVVVGGQKIAGVLCEVRTDGFVVAGVGINLAFVDGRPDENALALNDLLDDWLPSLDYLVAEIVQNVSFLVGLDLHEQREAVNSVLGTIGRSVQVLGRDGSRYVGQAEELDENGGLIVRAIGGSSISVTSSDIEHLYQ